MEFDFTRTPDEEVELGSLTIETGEMPDASVIWLHGLGADGRDFEDIVPQLLLPAAMPTRFIFPDAPVGAVTINGCTSGSRGSGSRDHLRHGLQRGAPSRSHATTRRPHPARGY